MIKSKNYQQYILKTFFTLSILCIINTSDLTGQDSNPVEGYSVREQVVTEKGEGVRFVEEGENGDYYIEYFGFYKDTMSINSQDHQIVFDDHFDPLSSFHSKIIRYNKEHEPMDEQIVYNLIGNNSLKLQSVRYDGRDLFLEFDILIRTDIEQEFYVGDKIFKYGPADFDKPLQGQIKGVLDGNTLEYKTQVLIQSDGVIGLDSWQAKDGFLYFRHTPIKLMVVASDNFKINHYKYLDHRVNVVKYDYLKEEEVCGQVVIKKIPISAASVNPQFAGLDIDDNGCIFISMVSLGYSFTLGNDNIPYTMAILFHGAVVALNAEGEALRSDVINRSAFVLDVEFVGEYSYILIQVRSDFIDYRGQIIGSESEELTRET